MQNTQSRAERLKALKLAKSLIETEEADTKEAKTEPVLKFRNYEIRDSNIKHTKVAAAQPPPMTQPVAESTTLDNPDLVMDVAPKKANWDLKRDVEEKLELLERRTQRALILLQQEEERKRLEAEGGIADEDEVTTE
eukprot:g4394.t1